MIADVGPGWWSCFHPASHYKFTHFVDRVHTRLVDNTNVAKSLSVPSNAFADFVGEDERFEGEAKSSCPPFCCSPATA